MTASLTIIKANQFVAMAADSLVTNLHNEPVRIDRKIGRAGDFLYLPNNFVEYSPADYNLRNIIQNIPPQQTHDALAGKIREAVVSPLVKALTKARQTHPESFEKSFDGRQALGLVLSGFQNGQPALVDLGFDIVDHRAEVIELKLDWKSSPGPDIPGGVGSVFVGDRYTKDLFREENPHYFFGDADRVTRNAGGYVQMAIKHGKSSAGGPIVMLTITATGCEWRVAP